MEQRSAAVVVLEGLKKYRFAVLILVLGLTLMLLPTGGAKEKTAIPVQPQEEASLEVRLSQILCRIDGVGAVRVLLTEQSDGEVVYQTDRQTDRNQTVLASRGSGVQEGLIRSSSSPVYRGALVICDGADRPTVKASVIEAVSRVTGLRSDQISVLKMK